MRTQSGVLQRLPCLVAHLIAESLGYFTPEAAANAIAYYTRGEAFFCEWYHDWASKRCRNTKADLRDTVLEVGELAIRNAVSRRSHHRWPNGRVQACPGPRSSCSAGRGRAAVCILVLGDNHETNRHASPLHAGP